MSIQLSQMANSTQSIGQSSSNTSSSNESQAFSPAAANADETAPVSNPASSSTPNAEEQPEPFTTFHPFSRLPPEIKNMILETAVNFSPAVVHARCNTTRRDGSSNTREVKFTTSHSTKTSEFKKLINLGDAIPDFKSFIEHKFGLNKFGLNFGSLRGNVHLALRGNQDILALDMRVDPNTDWRLRATDFFRQYNECGIHQPGILNIGIHFNSQKCRSLDCRVRCWPHLTSNALEHQNLPFCPYELGMFSKNFSHLENVFILILLKPNHFVRHETHEVHFSEVKEWVRQRQGDARRKGLAVFQDQQRTWVEIQNVEGVKDELVSSITKIFHLLKQTRKSFKKRDGVRKPSDVPRQDVGFRFLVSNYRMK